MADTNKTSEKDLTGEELARARLNLISELPISISPNEFDRDLADPSPDYQYKAIPEFRLVVRQIASNRAAQKRLLDPLLVGGVGPKGWKPKETERETEGNSKYPHGLKAWKKNLDQTRASYNFLQGEFSKVVASAQRLDDSDYFACVSAAVADLRGYPDSDTTLVVAGDLILDRNQDVLPSGKPLDKVRHVVVYSDCRVSTAFDPPAGHLQTVPRGSHCDRIEAEWRKCFYEWGAQDVKVVHRGDLNPFVGTSRPNDTSGGCLIRNEIPGTPTSTETRGR